MLFPAGPAILAEYYSLLALAFTLIIIRIYVRARVTQGDFRLWGWDDTCIIISLVCLLVGSILIHLEVNYGLGKHIVDLEDGKKDALALLKFNTFFQMVNVLCTLFTKFSIAFYILRFRDDIRLRCILTTFMAFMTVATIAVILVLSLSCRPLRRLWTPEIPGQCVSQRTIYIIAYIQSAFTIVIDIGLSLVPILILWHIRIEAGRKVLVYTLMSLGLIATVSNALRNILQAELTSKDFTCECSTQDRTVASDEGTPDNMIGSTIVSILELSSGIIAACIPTCIPILKLRRIQAERLQARGYRTNSEHIASDPRCVIILKSFAINMGHSKNVVEDNKSESKLAPLHV